MSGSHRADGLFVLAGDRRSRAGAVDGAQIADMAPTILALVRRAGARPTGTGASLPCVGGGGRATGGAGGDASGAGGRLRRGRRRPSLQQRLTQLGYLD